MPQPTSIHKVHKVDPHDHGDDAKVQLPHQLALGDLVDKARSPSIFHFSIWGGNGILLVGGCCSHDDGRLGDKEVRLGQEGMEEMKCWGKIRGGKPVCLIYVDE